MSYTFIWAMVLALAVTVTAQYSCALCPASGSICCDCCSGGLPVLGACNSLTYEQCSATRTPSGTPLPSTSVMPSATSTSTPGATALKFRNLSLAFQSTCSVTTWTVPLQVTNITIRMWGAAGSNACIQGGAGAFLQGVAPVTPGETLYMVVGGYRETPCCNSFPDLDICGRYGPGCGPMSGGGHSAVYRISVFDGSNSYIAVAGGGGGGGCGGEMGEGGLGIPIAGCGTFAPQGAVGQCCANSGGGGGGWIGGPGNSCGQRGRGGTSCGQGLFPSGLVSLPALSNYAAPNAQSPYYISGRAVNQGGGLIVITWDGINDSPSITSSLTSSPTPTCTSTSSPPVTKTRTSGSTASMTVTPTGSQFCKAELYALFIDSDLIGARLGGVAFTATERQCQELCCNRAACEGYAYDTLDLLRGSGSAACFVLTNVTERIPSNGRSCGALQTVLSASS